MRRDQTDGENTMARILIAAVANGLMAAPATAQALKPVVEDEFLPNIAYRAAPGPR